MRECLVNLEAKTSSPVGAWSTAADHAKVTRWARTVGTGQGRVRYGRAGVAPPWAGLGALGPIG
jgi:hypothetical protein